MGWCVRVGVTRRRWIIYVLLEKAIYLLFGWRNWVGKHSSNILNVVPLCLMWTLLREQNCHTFEDTKSFKTQLIGLFNRSLINWYPKAWGFTNSNSIVEFIVLTLLHIMIIIFLCNFLDCFVFIIQVHEVVFFQ